MFHIISLVFLYLVQQCYNATIFQFLKVENIFVVYTYFIIQRFYSNVADSALTVFYRDSCRRVNKGVVVVEQKLFLLNSRSFS
jgi:hypothetical protein